MQAELERREGEIEDEIEREREGDQPWDLAGEGFIKYRAERNRDNRIKQSPNGPKNPSRRSPTGLNQSRVPSVCSHPSTLPRASKRSCDCDEADKKKDRPKNPIHFVRPLTWDVLRSHNGALSPDLKADHDVRPHHIHPAQQEKNKPHNILFHPPILHP